MNNKNFIQNKYGYCYYCICDNCSMIYNLYIEKEYRRKGHAKNIIQLVINEIRKTGYSKDIMIDAVPRENSVDVKTLSDFYERMGLKIRYTN
ncbi:GNAT family N-acetyltransferase [Lacrimispora sp.]|uniref:GNAT family N-acetyltransferase n=1 Tax=Lacrimispora sp. TaxID=2719234 RepID=UPI0032E3F250